MTATYAPYTGPAGPSFEQSSQNNQYMLEQLLSRGYNAGLRPDWEAEEYCGLDSDENPEVVEIDFGNGQKYVVGYDRFGYTLSHSLHNENPVEYDEVDQAEPEEVYAALENIKNLLS